MIRNFPEFKLSDSFLRAFPKLEPLKLGKSDSEKLEESK